MKNRLIYICSPLRGDYQRNQQCAKEYCRVAFEMGFIPIAPHIYFTQFLDDDKQTEREQGMAAGLELLKECSELWAFIPDSGPTDGMRQEMEMAMINNIDIRYIYQWQQEIIKRIL